MSAQFSKVWPKILDIETDKVTNDPDDPGGVTKFGIAQNFHPELDVPNMTNADAQEFFTTNFWDKYRLGEFSDQEIADQVMLGVINTNPVKVGIALQDAILQVRPNTVTADGVIGDRTIAAINAIALDNEALQWCNDNLRLQMIEIYCADVRQRPASLKYLVGWIKRAIA